MKRRLCAMATYVAIGLAAFALTAQMAVAFEPAVEQWRPAVDEACAVHGCSTDYLLGIIACESGGDPNAVSAAINPGTGEHDYGLLQVSTIWGGQNMGPVEQIWFAAANLGSVWWVCG